MEKRGFEKLSKRELLLLNVVKEHGVARSFYSPSGDVIKSRAPSEKEMRRFARKHSEIYALDGTIVKRMPYSGRELYLFCEKHGISTRIAEAIREETMKLNDSVRKRIFARDGRECAVCGSNEKLCIDHIFPVSRGGFTRDDNLQVLCEKCNLQKNNMTLEEFLKWRKNHGWTTDKTRY